MATCNYEKQTDLYSIFSWHGGDSFEITGKYFPKDQNDDEMALYFRRQELKDLKELIDKALNETEEIGYDEIVKGKE